MEKTSETIDNELLPSGSSDILQLIIREVSTGNDIDDLLQQIFRKVIESNDIVT